jgi:hypothetical protein
VAILTCPGCGRGRLRVPDGRRGTVTCLTCKAEWFYPERVEVSEVEFRCSASGALYCCFIEAIAEPVHHLSDQTCAFPPAYTRGSRGCSPKRGGRTSFLCTCTTICSKNRLARPNNGSQGANHHRELSRAAICLTVAGAVRSCELRSKALQLEQLPLPLLRRRQLRKMYRRTFDVRRHRASQTRQALSSVFLWQSGIYLRSYRSL